MARNRCVTIDFAAFRALDQERRERITANERMKAERNKASEEIARRKKAGEDASELLVAMKRVSDEIKLADERVTVLDAELADFMLTVPNRPHSSVPVGHDASANVEVRRWGAPPKFDFKPLDDATDRLKKSAKAYDDAFASNAAGLSADGRAHLMALMQTIDQTLAPDVGLPERPWFKNLIYAPGRFTGYGAKTLPGVREAIEEERWEDANRYITLTAGVLNAYSDRLDQATAVLKGK